MPACYFVRGGRARDARSGGETGGGVAGARGFIKLGRERAKGVGPKSRRGEPSLSASMVGNSFGTLRRSKLCCLL